MEGTVLLEISKRIKSYRIQMNYTLQELANLSNVSKGMISQIENGRSIPSLPVLLSIIQSLELNLSDFFKDIAQKEDLVLIGKKNAYERFQKEDAAGFLYERFLTKSMKDCTIDIVLLTIEPKNYRDQVVTDAFEYKYIISGAVEYVIADQTYCLEEGDSLFFDGRLKHVPVNHGSVPCKMLIVYFFNSQS